MESRARRLTRRRINETNKITSTFVVQGEVVSGVTRHDIVAAIEAIRPLGYSDEWNKALNTWIRLIWNSPDLATAISYGSVYLIFAS